MERVNVENERGYQMDVEKARADNGRSKRISCCTMSLQ